MALIVRDPGLAQASLLVRRTSFGIKNARIQEFSGMSKEAAVEAVLSAPIDNAQAPQGKANEAVTWWFTKIKSPDSGIQDRMAFFWHSMIPSHMYQVGKQELVAPQLNLLRKNALGNYRELMHGIVEDGAMLRYLNATSSTAKKPNENLARELMELFTVGVDHSYTEEDIRQAAIAMAGWQVDNDTFQVSYNPERGYGADETVTFLGETKHWDVHSIVDRLCNDAATANRVSAKVWFYLTGDKANVPSDLGQQWQADNLEILPLVRRILLSETFWANNFGRARSGFEYHAAVMEAADLPPKDIYRANRVGQMPYQPPNVAGWQEGDAWLGLDSTMRFGNASSSYNLNPLTDKARTTDEILDYLGIYAIMEENYAVINEPLPVDKLGEDGAVRLLWVLALNCPEFRKQ